MRSARKLFALFCASTLFIVFSTNAAGANGKRSDQRPDQREPTRFEHSDRGEGDASAEQDV